MTEHSGRLAADLTPETLLVIDDDHHVARLQQRLLEKAGYSVVSAVTPDAARARLRDTRIDLIILDYQLTPTVNGLDFYSEMRANGFNFPVILVTGFSTEGVVIRALRAGVRDLVPKSPEYLAHLVETVRRVLREAQTERSLAESEAWLGSIIGSVLDAIVVTGPDLQITLFNPAAEKMFGCPAANAIGRRVETFLGPEVVGAIDNSGPGTTQATNLQGLALCGRRAGGGRFSVEASVSRVEIGGQSFSTIVVRDVTERERSAAKIREQAALLDLANDAILVRDPDGAVVFWNRGAERLYGWTAAEVAAGAVGPTLSREFFLSMNEAHSSIQETGEWAGEVRHVQRDGQEVVVESRWARVDGPDRWLKGTLIIDTDVTERKQLEAQYLHAQKMEAVGRLAGGVAHDFNNLLTIILGYCEILLANPAFTDEARESLTGMFGAAERGASLTRQLLSLSRRDIVAPRVLDLNRLIREAERMFRRLIGDDIALAVDLTPNLGRVKADAGQLEQVLLNLVVNARDAMPNGGSLTLETRNVALDARSARHISVRPDEYVRVTVRDTGHGMDASTLSRAFEPFFTTKELGKGTGLGLAAVHGIITQAGGHVELTSEVGRGTVVEIYLPQVTWAPETDSGIVSVQSPRGTETVLLVEDQDEVRLLARAALEAAGYTVVEASCGEEALHEADDYSGQIHLLLADVAMPEVGGPELADLLILSRPEIKVLLMSGHPDDPSPQGCPGGATVAFLQKPFTRVSLAQKVRQVLDAAHPPAEGFLDGPDPVSPTPPPCSGVGPLCWARTAGPE